MTESEPPEFAITREMHAAWNDGNIERMTDFWTDDGDWFWEDIPELPDAQKLRGREAVEARLREVMDLIGDLRLETESISIVGDEVLADVKFAVDGAHSGVHLVDDSYHLIRYEGGRVRRYRVFTDRDQALAAAEAR